MIKSNTYIAGKDLKRDLLAAFTSIDHSVSKALPDEEIERHFRRFLIRISSLCFYHGEQNPFQFLKELSETIPENAFHITNGYIELGHANSSLDENKILPKRELQQEIVHFSRIVDIEPSNNNDIPQFRSRRLRKTTSLPISLKVLTEIMTVARSRHLQRGKEVATPEYRRPGSHRQHFGDYLYIQTAIESSDYMLFVGSPSRTLRRNASYYYENLLTYLTPIEASIALCAYLSETQPKNDIEILLLTPNKDGSIDYVNWNHKSGDLFQDSIAWCEAHLPVITHIPATNVLDRTKDLLHKFTSHADLKKQEIVVNHLGLQVDLFHAQEHISLHVVPKNDQVKYSLDQVIEKATDELCSSVNEDIISMECGHIHLDREVDIDQEIGIKIGSQVYQSLSKRQKTPPLLTPMVDDDHVLIQLLPEEYSTFFAQNIGKNETHFELIP